MDIVRTKSKNKIKPRVVGGLAAGLLLLIGWSYASNRHGSELVAKDALLVDRVQQGNFDVTVRGVGVLVQKDVRWVATEVDGRVEQIYVKAGARVKAGDVIMELVNPQLVQQLEESQWQLEETEADLNAQRVALESQVLDQQTLVINSKLNYERSLLTLNAQESLLAQGIGAVSTVNHEEVKIDAAQLKQRWQLEQKRLAKSEENQTAQRRAFAARLTRMQRMVARFQSQVNSLTVRASMDSIVQEMPLEAGQQVHAGANLARLAKSGEFIAEIHVPEQQVSNVAIGQQVVLDTKANKVKGQVKRIDPSVSNGTVQVDVELLEAPPKEARPELTVDGIIKIAKLDNVLYVKRPLFAKAFSRGSVYALNEAGNSARRTEVEYGQVSNTHIEIKQGLRAGESIIVSDVSAWQDHSQIQLK